MSLNELQRTLPNGLHDARLVGVHIDYESCEATLLVDVDVSNSNDASELDPVYRGIALRFQQIQFFIIDPPHEDRHLNRPSAIDAGDGQPMRAAIQLPTLREQHFLCWIFVEDSNSFIRIAARSVSLAERVSGP